MGKSPDSPQPDRLSDLNAWVAGLPTPYRRFFEATGINAEKRARFEAVHSSLSMVLLNGLELIRAAVREFTSGSTRVSCFLAMAAIEEVGKLPLMRYAELSISTNLEYDPKKAARPLADHTGKALVGVAMSLMINAAVDRRHGSHPESQVALTSGIMLLIRSGQWMSFRNACLYVDVDLSGAQGAAPMHLIGKPEAYYFICMAYEVLMSQAHHGLVDDWHGGSNADAAAFRADRLDELTDFMSTWAAKVDITEIPFLVKPDAYRRLARIRAGKN